MSRFFTEGFRVNKKVYRKRLANRKRRLARRLDKFNFPDDLSVPMMRAPNIQYEVAERTVGTSYGGIGLVHQLVGELDLAGEIDKRLGLFKIHLPYHESDHVLNLAYNALCTGTCLQDLELRRQDEAYLNALGAERIPDPTTASDFCRRFCRDDLSNLQAAIDAARLKVWARQGEEFLAEACIEADGTFVVTGAECKQGIDRTYKRQYKDIRLESEEVAEFMYRPTACKRAYRIIVLRKNLHVNEPREGRFFEDYRYFFYITNELEPTPAECVFSGNQRCNQENILAQLGSLRALHAPVNDLLSNEAYMLCTSLAWNLKAWLALWLPDTPGRWAEKHQAQKQRLLKLEFRTFANYWMRIPCQVLKTGRRIICRLLAWNEWQDVFFRLAEQLSRPLRR